MPMRGAACADLHSAHGQHDHGRDDGQLPQAARPAVEGGAVTQREPRTAEAGLARVTVPGDL